MGEIKLTFVNKLYFSHTTRKYGVVGKEQNILYSMVRPLAMKRVPGIQEGYPITIIGLCQSEPWHIGRTL